jgi:coenzyme F420-0:L-glutamate ligase/coenzyme F420-1:gamma-L-glutamate ligase
MPRKRELRAIPISGMGEMRPGDSVADEILAALRRRRLKLKAGDILVVTHKIVSKAEGRIVALASVQPSAAARRWVRRYGGDARAVQLALSQSRRVVRKGHGVIITETHHGLVCANSAVDLSNVDGGKSAVLLPRDPDASARKLHRALKRRLRMAIPIVISDTFGRAWREGLCEVAIGLAGMKPFRDYRGAADPRGYRLKSTVEAVADELACMAGLACDKLSRSPACIIRGFAYPAGRGRARDIVRRPELDLFR